MALGLSLLGVLAQPVLREYRDPLVIAAIAVLLGWAARAVNRHGLPFPYRSWQVPQQWRYTLPPAITLGTYGYLLGLGWLTYMVLPTYWLLVAGTVALGNLPVSLAAWTTFAIGRFLTTRRGARLVVLGADDVTPPNLFLTRVAAAGLLILASLALTVQLV